MPATVIAERVGWTRGMTVRSARVRELRPAYLPPDPSSRTEVAARENHGGDGRIRAARFPARKSLEEFDFDHARGRKRDVIAHLGTLDFIAARPGEFGRFVWQGTREHGADGRSPRAPRGRTSASSTRRRVRFAGSGYIWRWEGKP